MEKEKYMGMDLEKVCTTLIDDHNIFVKTLNLCKMIAFELAKFDLIFSVSIDGESCLLPPRYRKRPKNCYSYDEKVSF